MGLPGGMGTDGDCTMVGSRPPLSSCRTARILVRNTVASVKVSTANGWPGSALRAVRYAANHEQEPVYWRTTLLLTTRKYDWLWPWTRSGNT